MKLTKDQLQARLAVMQAAAGEILRFEEEIKTAEAKRDLAIQERAKALDEFRFRLKTFRMRDDYSPEGAVTVLKAELYDLMSKEAQP